MCATRLQYFACPIMPSRACAVPAVPALRERPACRYDPICASSIPTGYSSSTSHSTLMPGPYVWQVQVQDDIVVDGEAQDHPHQVELRSCLQRRHVEPERAPVGQPGTCNVLLVLLCCTAQTASQCRCTQHTVHQSRCQTMHGDQTVCTYAAARAATCASQLRRGLLHDRRL